MTVPVSMTPAPAFGRVSLMRTALVLMRLAWARTGSWLLLLGVSALLLLPVLFSLIFASRGALSGDPVDFLLARYDTIVSGLATPLIALLLGTSAFSAETDDGTLLYIVTTTTPRWWIVSARLLFAALLTGVLASLSVLASGFVAVGLSNPEGIVTAFSVAVFYGGVTYSALFTMLALLTRRSLVMGLVYVLFWEGALSETFQAIQFLSVRKWMTAVAEPLIAGGGDGVGPSATYALIAAAVVVVLTVYVGGRRLHEPRMGRIGS
ncbi:ABC transporter permease [Gemmatimonas phototrophica]|uniref:ABC transporter permease n=1 Tax=Gemmatimonas phototrophica TaxID=1379270 RepID=UPI0006A74F09|nr:ABC transporter permease [Gemmatimonas phototrophica]